MNDTMDTLEVVEVKFYQNIGVVFGRKEALKPESLMRENTSIHVGRLGLFEADASRFEPLIRSFFDEWEEL